MNRDLTEGGAYTIAVIHALSIGQKEQCKTAVTVNVTESAVKVVMNYAVIGATLAVNKVGDDNK